MTDCIGDLLIERTEMGFYVRERGGEGSLVEVRSFVSIEELSQFFRKWAEDGADARNRYLAEK